MSIEAAFPCCCVPASCCFPVQTITLDLTITSRFSDTFNSIAMHEVIETFIGTLVLTKNFSGGMDGAFTSKSMVRTSTKREFLVSSYGYLCAGLPDNSFCPPCVSLSAPVTITHSLPANAQAFANVTCGGACVPSAQFYSLNISTGQLTAAGALPQDGLIVDATIVNGCFTADRLQSAFWEVNSVNSSPAFLFAEGVRCSTGYPPMTMCQDGLFSTGGLLYSPFSYCSVDIEGFGSPWYNWPTCAILADSPSYTFPAFSDFILETCDFADCSAVYVCRHLDCFGNLLPIELSCGCDNIPTSPQTFRTVGMGRAAEGLRRYTLTRDISVTAT